MIEFFKWILPTTAMADWIPIKIKHDYKGYAKEFYNQGYRKIDKDARVFIPTDEQYVMLSREEYESLKQKQTISYTASINAWYLDRISQLENRLETISKETAEKIIKRLYELRDCYDNSCSFEIRLSEDNFEELAKQFGVESLGE